MAGEHFQHTRLFVVVELYTYSEEPEFVWNAEAFNVFFQAKCK